MKAICTVVKINGRYKGYPTFTHYVSLRKSPTLILYRSDYIADFCELREWCRNTWGPSCELDDYDYIAKYNEMWKQTQDKDSVLNEFWAWHVKDNTRRIYLTEKGKSWFDLAWS